MIDLRRTVNHGGLEENLSGRRQLLLIKRSTETQKPMRDIQQVSDF